MKRSEMLEILEDAIDNSYDYATDTGPTYDYDSILRELEDAGMSPPRLIVEGKPFIKFGIDETFTMNKGCKWEPEDD